MSFFWGGSVEKGGSLVLIQPRNQLDSIHYSVGIDTLELVTQATFEQPYTYEMTLALEGHRTTHYPKTRMFNYPFINSDFIKGFEKMRNYAEYLKNLLSGSLTIPRSSRFDIEEIYFNREAVVSRLTKDLRGQEAYKYMGQKVQDNYDPTNPVGAKVIEGVVFGVTYYERCLSLVSEPYLTELAQLHPGDKFVQSTS